MRENLPKLKKISLIDYKYFLDQNREKLASLLLKKTKTILRRSSDKKDLNDALLTSIAGISAAMKNTG